MGNNNQQNSSSLLSQNRYHSNRDFKQLAKYRHFSAEKFAQLQKSPRIVKDNVMQSEYFKNKLMPFNKPIKPGKIEKVEIQRDSSYFIKQTDLKRPAEENPIKFKALNRKKSKINVKQSQIQFPKTDRLINKLTESQNRSRSLKSSQRFYQSSFISPQNIKAKQIKNRIIKQTSLSKNKNIRSPKFLTKQNDENKINKNISTEKRNSVLQYKKSPIPKIKAQIINLKSNNPIKSKNKINSQHQIYFKRQIEDQQKQIQSLKQKKNKIYIPPEQHKNPLGKNKNNIAFENKIKKYPTTSTFQSQSSPTQLEQNIQNIKPNFGQVSVKMKQKFLNIDTIKYQQNQTSSQYLIFNNQKQYSILSGSQKNLSKMSLKQIQSQIQLEMEQNQFNNPNSNVNIVLDQSIIIRGLDQSIKKSQKKENKIKI